MAIYSLENIKHIELGSLSILWWFLPIKCLTWVNLQDDRWWIFTICQKDGTSLPSSRKCLGRRDRNAMMEDRLKGTYLKPAPDIAHFCPFLRSHGMPQAPDTSQLLFGGSRFRSRLLSKDNGWKKHHQRSAAAGRFQSQRMMIDPIRFAPRTCRRRSGCGRAVPRTRAWRACHARRRKFQCSRPTRWDWSGRRAPAGCGPATGAAAGYRWG